MIGKKDDYIKGYILIVNSIYIYIYIYIYKNTLKEYYQYVYK